MSHVRMATGLKSKRRLESAKEEQKGVCELMDLEREKIHSQCLDF